MGHTTYAQTDVYRHIHGVNKCEYRLDDCQDHHAHVLMRQNNMHVKAIDI